MASAPPPGRTVDAVVFDCDGVLVDSEPLHADATREYFRSHGVALGEHAFADLIGMRVRDQVTRLSEAHGLPGDQEEHYAGREQVFWRMAESGIATTPGAAETIRALHAAGIRVGVATSGTRRWVEHVLDALAVQDVVDAVATGEDVTRPKPDPEPYLVAARRLATEPGRCVAVEDSPAGVASASAAGMAVLVFDPSSHAGSARDGTRPVISELRDVLGRLGLREGLSRLDR